MPTCSSALHSTTRAQNRLRTGKHVPGGNMPGIARPRRERASCAGLAKRCEEPRRAQRSSVVRFIRDVLGRTCYAVDVPKQPTIMPLTRIQHLMTPARAKLLEGVDLWSMMGDLHPTPAVSGTPVGRRRCSSVRSKPIAPASSPAQPATVDAAGDGEFSVALRTGVFDGEISYINARMRHRRR